jgi:hypothetical protein
MPALGILKMFFSKKWFLLANYVYYLLARKQPCVLGHSPPMKKSFPGPIQWSCASFVKTQQKPNIVKLLLYVAATLWP